MAIFPAIGSRQNQTRALRRGLIGTVVIFVAALSLVAYASPSAQTVSSKAAVAPDAGQRSSKSSGIAYGGGPVPAVEIGPPRTNLAGAHRLGSSDAKIGIVEFSDYQCPYCGGFHEQIFPKLKQEYVDSGIVQFIHKDLPLSMIHTQALPAALAANCAGVQHHFWEMNNALYAHQRQLGQALYSELARTMNLDAEKFMGCLKDPAIMRGIMQDTVEAQRLGINGTPSFLIGKIEGNTLTIVTMARGAPSFEAFAQEIEKLRQPVDPNPASPAK